MHRFSRDFDTYFSEYEEDANIPPQSLRSIRKILTPVKNSATTIEGEGFQLELRVQVAVVDSPIPKKKVRSSDSPGNSEKS